MRRKLRVSLLLQPLATALFANSPFTEGKPNGFLSYRAQVWTDTDNRRAGIPKVMFEDGFGFERYAAWLIEQVPMYFVYRDGGYIDVAGESFADFIAGRLPSLAGVTASIGDFSDHLTTAFTDVRLKRFLEMRGADAGRPDMMLAQSALWVGLLYDDAALTAVEALLRGAGWEDAVAARAAVPRQGLAAPWRGGTLRDIVADVVGIAKDGLRSRGCLDAAGQDERYLLAAAGSDRRRRANPGGILARALPWRLAGRLRPDLPRSRDLTRAVRSDLRRDRPSRWRAICPDDASLLQHAVRHGCLARRQPRRHNPAPWPLQTIFARFRAAPSRRPAVYHGRPDRVPAGLRLGSWLIWLGLIFTLFCLFFFRDPERVPPTRARPSSHPPMGAWSPWAYRTAARSLGWAPSQRWRISIFLSVLNVHVNRVPADGVVTRIAYRHGAFVSASLDKASTSNERNALAIRLPTGKKSRSCRSPA